MKFDIPPSIADSFWTSFWNGVWSTLGNTSQVNKALQEIKDLIMATREEFGAKLSALVSGVETVSTDLGTIAADIKADFEFLKLKAGQNMDFSEESAKIDAGLEKIAALQEALAGLKAEGDAVDSAPVITPTPEPAPEDTEETPEEVEETPEGEI